MATPTISLAAARLKRKLLAVDLGHLALSPYMSRYLNAALAENVVRVGVYEQLLGLALEGRRLSEAVVVDYGGGHGLLSLLARESGVGTVVYTDILPVATEDAARLGAYVGLSADHYVTGDAATLRAFLRGAQLVPTAVCSNDVVEHVYNLRRHFDDVAALSETGLRIVMASEANGANPRIRRRTTRMQREVELHDRPHDPAGRPIDSERAYRTIRAEMIRRSVPRIAQTDVERLARLTRGLAGSDVERAAEAFAATGRLPRSPSHSTNTCDPATGNWAERLITPSAIARMVEMRGFRARTVAGRYSSFSGPKGYAAATFNLAIRVIGPLGLVIAPFYVVVAERAHRVRSLAEAPEVTIET